MKPYRPAVPSLLALALTVTVTACTDSPPTYPTADPVVSMSSADAPRMAMGLNGHFARIARDFEGFGGMYRDEEGRLHVFVKDAAMSESDVRTELSRAGRSFFEMQGKPARIESPVVVHQADYDFMELARWHEDMLPVLGIDGVVFTDIDESQNRLRIGMERGTSWEAIQEELANRGVPLEAVTTVRAQPVVPLTGTLQDLQRPRAGGPQIVWERPGVSWFVCTTGFNITREEAGQRVPYFMTNSHCSAQRSTVTGTEYFQALPEIFGGHAREFVGTEVQDPPFFTAPCFAGFVCRWSDALIARYERENPVRFGTIYRTTFFGTGSSVGSLQVEDEEGKFFTIQDEIPFPELNDVVNKMGRTTGWTQGPVVITCGNFAVAGAAVPTAMLCQDVVAAVSAGGDSGSPVFTWEDPSKKDVHLNGILWGGGEIGGVTVFVFSAMENIRLELEPFRTH